MSDEAPTKAMRPNDMCTASYYDDVAKLKELLTVPEVEDEPPLPEDFDPSDQPPEEEVEGAEEDTQEAEELKEREEQRKKNAETIERLISTPDLLTTRLSPVNISKYGLHLYVKEDNYVCTSFFKTSKKSTIAATPLHWAVLARSHKAIDFLVANGASLDAKCPVLEISPVELAEANKSLETLRLMRIAKEKYAAVQKAKADAVELREKTVADRAEAVKEHRRKMEEEERLAAEREAAEEAEEYGGEQGGDEGEGEVYEDDEE